VPSWWQRQNCNSKHSHFWPVTLHKHRELRTQPGVHTTCLQQGQGARNKNAWLQRASGRRSSCAYAICVIHCNVSLVGACSTRVTRSVSSIAKALLHPYLLANFLASACGHRLHACKSTTAHGAAFVCTRTASHAPIAPRSRPCPLPPLPLPLPCRCRVAPHIYR
jgi:hypothetical protein